MNKSYNDARKPSPKTEKVVYQLKSCNKRRYCIEVKQKSGKM